MHREGNFLTVNLTTIAINSTVTIVTGSSGTALVVPTNDIDYLFVSGKATGEHAQCSKDIVFNFVASPDGITYDTIVFGSLRVALTGTSVVQGSTILNVSGAKSVMLLSVQNFETVTSLTATAVNCSYGVKEVLG